jgi:hypothetical protein
MAEPEMRRRIASLSTADPSAVRSIRAPRALASDRQDGNRHPLISSPASSRPVSGDDQKNRKMGLRSRSVPAQ